MSIIFAIFFNMLIIVIFIFLYANSSIWIIYESFYIFFLFILVIFFSLYKFYAFLLFARNYE